MQQQKQKIMFNYLFRLQESSLVSSSSFNEHLSLPTHLHKYVYSVKVTFLLCKCELLLHCRM